MSQAQTALRLGVQHHRSGQLDEAQRLYRQVLRSEPGNAEAHCLLGMIALAQGEPAAAVTSIGTAVAHDPRSAKFRLHLGRAYQAWGQPAQAVGCFREAVRLQPGVAAAHNELGNALRETGQLAESEACFRTAIRLDPRLAVAHNNLGNTLKDQHRLAEATASFVAAARLEPGTAEIHGNLANCLRAQENYPAAIAAYRRALALRPELAIVHYQLATALHHENEFAAAIDAHREAVRLKPDFAAAHNDMGAAFQALGELEAAKACFSRALEIDPQYDTAVFNVASALQAERRLEAARDVCADWARRWPENPDAHYRLAKSLHALGEFDEAIHVYRRAIALKPDHAEAHYYCGTSLLSLGRFAEGWPEYAWRRKTRGAPPPRHQPLWNGEELDGRRILIHAEWGFGDTLQFVRYIPMVEQRGGSVVLEVDKRIMPFLRECGFKDLAARGQIIEAPVNVQLPMLDLPRIFGTSVDTIPATIPYLSAGADRVAMWRERLARHEGFRIGICWRGSKQAAEEHRSIPLAAFAQLARVAGVTLFSLQTGDGIEEWKQASDPFELVDLGPALDAEGAFLDTAAVMKNLDLVVTCDTSPVHLAGALGLPVWNVLMLHPEWRWLRDRHDSPWYPTMRLFRQKRLDDWDEVFERMAEELTVLARAGARG